MTEDLCVFGRIQGKAGKDEPGESWFLLQRRLVLPHPPPDEEGLRRYTILNDPA
jgi:hypothetical protein